MLVREEEEGGRTLFDRTYEILLKSGRKSGGITVFVAPDVDALCACAIWLGLLKSDQLQYRVVPVAGYEDLYMSAREALRYQDRACALFLNCGGQVDLCELLDSPATHMYFVMDTHRPIHLSNVASSQVVVLYDGHPEYYATLVAAGLLPPRTRPSKPKSVSENLRNNKKSRKDSRHSAFSPSTSSSENDDDQAPVGGDRDESDDHSDDDPQSGDDNEEEEEEELDGVLGGEDGDVSSMSVEEERELLREFEDGQLPRATGEAAVSRIANSLTHAQSSTLESLREALSQRIERVMRHGPGARSRKYVARTGHGTSLPSACLSYRLAAQRSANHVRYQWMAAVGLTDHWIRGLLTADRYQREWGYLSSEMGVHHAASGSTGGMDGRPPSSHVEMELSPSEEYNFYLMRHWSLYEAMYHSPLMASRFGIWKEGGRAKLHMLLAQAGIPLDDARQPFAAMSRASRDILRERFRGKLQELGYGELLYPSFVARSLYAAEVSAADVVLTTAAVLEYGLKGDASAGWRRNFWQAYDWLTGRRGDDELGAAAQVPLALARRLQESIVEQGSAILERRLLVLAGAFRYAFVPEGGELRYFANPHALWMLALFLAEHVALQRRGRPRPLMLCARDPPADAVLLVAVTRRDSDSRARFHASFLRAASRVRTHVVFQGFGSSVLAIHQNDLRRFMDLLLVYFS